mmetsp:Transcript_13022/g.28050  ORF Transcript_13022/g.28050 Transcript_13022/m.28050 type:complete len:96 (+) Transcript_13022:445-732(+)
MSLDGVVVWISLLSVYSDSGLVVDYFDSCLMMSANLDGGMVVYYLDGSDCIDYFEIFVSVEWKQKAAHEKSDECNHAAVWDGQTEECKQAIPCDG